VAAASASLAPLQLALGLIGFVSYFGFLTFLVVRMMGM